MTGFYKEHNTGMKWVTVNPQVSKKFLPALYCFHLAVCIVL